MSLGQWLRALRPGQIWTILTLLVGLVGGAFTLGYKIRGATADIQTARGEDATKSLGALEAKERFLSLYLRYLIAATDKTGLPDNHASPQIQESADTLKAYIGRLLAEREKLQDQIDVRGLVLGKPARHDSTARYEATVRFAYDGTVWPVPMQFGFASAAR